MKRIFTFFFLVSMAFAMHTVKELVQLQLQTLQTVEDSLSPDLTGEAHTCNEAVLRIKNEPSADIT